MIEHRVVGPPGTGKTTYLSRQCLAAAERYGGGGVAIASLTRAAAREIASRSTNVPLHNIGTLHAHAYRRLERPALCETTDGVRDWNENCGVTGWRLTNRSVANPENAGPDDLGVQGEDGGDALLSEVGVLRARMVDQRVWPNRVRGFWKRWTEWKDDTGRVDFTDLIERAIDEIDSIDASVIMLDEAQDMSRLELTLARKWGEDADQLVICGDPDQNLYEWRGSDPSAFYAAEAASSRTLAQSYRVPVAVHGYAVSWIEQLRDRVPVEYRPTDVLGRVQQHQGLAISDGQGTANLVASLIEDGSTVMVLASCGYMLNPVVGALRDAAIPFHNPYRITQGAWNPLNAAKRLLAFLRPSKEAWGDEARLWTWEEVRQWMDPMLAKGVITRGSKAWIENKAKGSRLDDEDDRIIKDLQSLLNCFEPEHWDDVVSLSVDWWLSRLKHDDRKRQRYVTDLSHLRGPRVLRERPRVIVGTVHSVKGGEADKVVLAPDLSRAGIEEWLGRGQAPIVRMFYVGMTRARQELHILGPSTQDHAPI